MRGKHLWTNTGRNQPITCDWNPFYKCRILRLLFFPVIKVHRSREWRHHHKLGKSNVRLQRQVSGRCKSAGLVGGQAKDERSQDMDAVFSERLELTN